MIEAGANEIPEAQMIEAIYKAHAVNQTIIEFIDKIVAEVGKEKHSYVSCAIPEELFDAIKEIVPPAEMEDAVFTDDKQTREQNIHAITERLSESFADKEEWLELLSEAVYQYQKKTVRKMILKDHKRPDASSLCRSGFDSKSSWFSNVHSRTDPNLQCMYFGSLVRATETGRIR